MPNSSYYDGGDFGISTGDRWSVATVPAPDANGVVAFDLPVSGSPYADASIVQSSTVFAGSCSVSYSVSIHDVRMTLTGPTLVGNTQKLATGQKLRATVSGMSGANDTYTWATPSDARPFADYQASASSATFTAFTAPPTTSTTTDCYFAKSGGPTIQCIYHSAQADVDVTLTESLSVEGPTALKSTTPVAPCSF